MVKGQERLLWSWLAKFVPLVSLLAVTVNLFTAKRLYSTAQGRRERRTLGNR